MKKLTGFSIGGVVIGVLILALLGVATYSIIDGNNKATDFSKYDFYSVIEGNSDNGGIGDHVKGNADAPVLIYEYADYQCSGCASVNPKVNQIIKDLDGKLGIVYRSFILKYHNNGTAAASAAEAAGLQGYWKEYADKLFDEQAEWASASPSERTALFDKYFEEVTSGEGDIDKFNQDIASEAVSKKISFDMGISQRMDIAATPAFYIDGQLIKWNDAGEVIVNGKRISWDSSRTGDDFAKLIKDIVAAKLGK
ncbi:MAG: thioredoxin domain-containing protein [Candidatus Saccharimonadaceae bacterium]|nr:thioredoxin domain-containing protein [Candidatus Saccharimonadaceae bacterium]